MTDMTNVLKILALCEGWTEWGLEWKQGSPRER